MNTALFTATTANMHPKAKASISQAMARAGGARQAKEVMHTKTEAAITVKATIKIYLFKTSKILLSKNLDQPLAPMDQRLKLPVETIL